MKVEADGPTETLVSDTYYTATISVRCVLNVHCRHRRVCSSIGSRGRTSGDDEISAHLPCSHCGAPCPGICSSVGVFQSPFAYKALCLVKYRNKFTFTFLCITALDRLCGLVVRVLGCRTEMYCVSCKVRTEFIYVM
jgi:hypothetical protein